MVGEYIENNISHGKKLLALLIDPEEYHRIDYTAEVLNHADIILIGGSTIEISNVAEVCKSIKELTAKPLILFPGSYDQLTREADATLFLSLLSGRNPEFLIGQQAKGAPIIEQLELETLSCAYILIGAENESAVSRVTDTKGMPIEDHEAIANTAMAGALMGMKHCYLEAGSGAIKSVPKSVISDIRKRINSIVWVGGGMKSAEAVQSSWNAGADIAVVGTWIEESPEAIFEINKAFNRKFTQAN